MDGIHVLFIVCVHFLPENVFGHRGTRQMLIGPLQAGSPFGPLNPGNPLGPLLPPLLQDNPGGPGIGGLTPRLFNRLDFGGGWSQWISKSRAVHHVVAVATLWNGSVYTVIWRSALYWTLYKDRKL
uniref:Uncharacterized protein LOC111126846 n=1 Tax=Crassostrea virginica TaxID=6565 RepID=A0A8B8DH35_CRAVI|nr:uncharacterized protein LOC111126846 [Crassostrea virginica]